MNLYQVLQTPFITEKTNLMKETENKVSFKVNPKSNKKEIKEAVEKIFSTKVEKVRVLNKIGKKKKQGKSEGKKPNWKKAIITLKKGEKISIFEGA